MNPRAHWFISTLILLSITVLSCGCSDKSTGGDDDDGVPPAQITDLSFSGFTASSVTLAWTAPGDDGTTGQAARYDIRYSTENNLWTDWDSATQVSGEPAPQAAGAAESMTIDGLDADTTYYFGITTYDEENNNPGISNVISVTCFDDYEVSFPDPALTAIIREKINKPTGAIKKSDVKTIIDLYAEDVGISDLTGLAECAELLFLNFQDNEIDDLSELAELPKLRLVNVAANAVTNIGPLENLSELEQLHLGYNTISDIAALAGLTNLTELRLNDNEIEDIISLTGLTALSVVDVRANKISDINPLVANSGLGSGDEVFLDYNLLSYQSVNEHIPALRARGVTVHLFDDVTAPAAATDLAVEAVTATSVTLAWTAPGDDHQTGIADAYDIRFDRDYSVVENWTDATPAAGLAAPDSAGETQTATVSELDTDTTYYFALKTRDEFGNWSEMSNIISGTPFEDAVMTFADANLEQAIRDRLNKPTGEVYRSDLLALDTLPADGREIIALTGLEYCVNLKSLNLNDNQISDLSAVAGLTGLHILKLDNNSVNSLNALANLVNLKELSVNGNQVSDLIPLAGLTNLYRLELKQNSITDLTPLAGLSNLTMLMLAENSVNNLTPLAGLTQMWWLDLWKNDIVALGPLANLTGIQYLFLGTNQIADISPLAGLTAMKSLYLDFNQIGDINALVGMTSIQQLYLRYNSIIDIGPLLNNAGLGAGDELGLDHNTLLSDQSKLVYIPELEARGVTVTY